MPHLELEPEKRRSIADALDVLHRSATFDGGHTVKLRIGSLRLPSQDIVGLPAVVAESAVGETTFIVSLPACKKVRARRHGRDDLEEFDIFQLDGATVCGSGIVELVDGRRLRAVEVVPVLLPYNVTDLDWRILHHTIAMMKAEQECYTYPMQEGCTYSIHFAQPSDALDCSKLPALRGKVPPRKEILRYIAKQDPALKPPSRQKIDDTLHKFGIL
ncbi:hypothetical protein ACNJYD_32585 [Bradyrhizobium sp. DASA03005]|uniref:hypothetical protein n=1 Tax=Bradyrhizobium sp. SPXBL-02 TaxID=3395912 RepID=UPI003F72D3AF